MAAPDVNSSFSKSAKVGLLALAMATMPFTAANDVQAQQPQQVSSNPHGLSMTGSLKECGEYAKKGGVGIIVNYGPENPISADELGGKFVQGFAKRGAHAKYFVVPTSAPGASISFCVGSLLSDPMNVSEAVKNVDEIVKMNRGYNNIVAGVDLKIN